MKKNFFLLFILIAPISNAQTNHVLDFDGSGDYVNLGTSVVNNVRTVEFWYKPAINVNSSITASGYTMLVRQDMSEYNEFGFAIYGTEWPLSLRGRMFFFMRDNGVLHEITSDSDTWDADTWYHIAGTIDPVSGMKFYVNGVLQSDTDPTGIYPIPASSEETMIGTWGNALIRHCNGQIEELSFWNVALTQPELHSDPCDFIIPGDEPALIGYWHMDEGSGLIIQDATSFNHDGSIVNANYVLNSNCSLLPPSPVDDSNYVLEFDGINDYVNLGNTAATSTRTVEFWFMPEVNITPSITDVSYTLVGRNDATQLKEFGFLIRGSEFSTGKGCLNFYVSNSGTYYNALSDNNTWTAGTWYHVCGTIDAANGMKLYINGVQQAVTDSYTSAIPAASEITTLGRWGDMSYRYFPGRMDELRFWDIALTEPEILENMCDTLVPADEPELIGYWKMNEGSGFTIFDETDYDHDGNIIGAIYEQDSTCASVPPVPQDENYVLGFDGINDYVDLGNNAATSTRSIEFWFKPDHTLTPSLTEDGVSLIVRNGVSPDKEFGFAIYGSEWLPAERGYLYFFIRNAGVLHEIKSNSNTWNANTWYHVCGTASATDGMKLYINGVLQTDTEPTGTIAIPASTDEINLGRWGDAGIRYFEGEMDELRFWDVALTQPEIEFNMCDTLITANEPALIGYWKMDEGTGSVLFDETDYEHDGAIVGAIYLQDTLCGPNDLGIDQNIEQIPVVVYPNPFSEYTTFSVNQPLSNATLTIYNAFGQQVKQVIAISDQTITLTADGLASGFYFFELKEDNQIISTGKLIVTQNL